MRGVLSSSRGAAAASLAGLALLAGCASVGEPLPPALHIPKPVANLGVEQVGARLEARFTLPVETTEDLPLTIAAVELKAGERVAPLARDAAAASLDATAWPAGQRLPVAMRVQSKQGKWSAWSPAVEIDIVAPVPAPASAIAESAPQGVRIAWKLPPERWGLAVRVDKRGPSGRFDEAAVVEQPAAAAAGEWIDAAAPFGEEQRYRLTTLAGPAARSESVELAPLTPLDRFPPAVPAGLAATPGLGSVELSWDRPADTDLAAFRVYREPAAGPPGFVRLGESAAANWSDRQAQPGASYRYAVAAVDQRGNESPRSPAVEVTAPN